MAARKWEQEQSSFIDLTADEPDAIEINDEGVVAAKEKRPHRFSRRKLC